MQRIRRSRHDALWDILNGYNVEKKGELKLFFEKLAVLEIRM